MSNLTKAKAAMRSSINGITGSSAFRPLNSLGQNINPAKDNAEEIRIAIKAERKKQGISQRELAKRSGYSQGTITRLETHMWISMNCLFHVVNGLGKKLILA